MVFSVSELIAYLSAAVILLPGDLKVLRIAGGSLEILRNYVARVILRSDTLRGL
jgi:hypothetical protein